MPNSLRARARHIRLHRLLSRLRGCDLRVGLVDSREGTFNLCILKVALPSIVFESGFCGFNTRSRLRHLRLVIVIVKLNQDVALVNLLVVVNCHLPHQSGNFCAERREIAANVRIIGYLLDPSRPPSHSNYE